MAQKEETKELDSFELEFGIPESLEEIALMEQPLGGIHVAETDTHKRLVIDNMPDQAEMVFNLHKTNKDARKKLNAAGVQYLKDIDGEGDEEGNVDILAANNKYIKEVKKIVQKYTSTGGRKKRKKRKTRRKSRKRKRKTKRRKKKRKTKKRRRR